MAHCYCISTQASSLDIYEDLWVMSASVLVAHLALMLPVLGRLKTESLAWLTACFWHQGCSSEHLELRVGFEDKFRATFAPMH